MKKNKILSMILSLAMVASLQVSVFAAGSVNVDKVGVTTTTYSTGLTDILANTCDIAVYGDYYFIGTQPTDAEGLLYVYNKKTNALTQIDTTGENTISGETTVNLYPTDMEISDNKLYVSYGSADNLNGGFRVYDISNMNDIKDITYGIGETVYSGTPSQISRTILKVKPVWTDHLMITYKNLATSNNKENYGKTELYKLENGSLVKKGTSAESGVDYKNIMEVDSNTIYVNGQRVFGKFTLENGTYTVSSILQTNGADTIYPIEGAAVLGNNGKIFAMTSSDDRANKNKLEEWPLTTIDGLKTSGSDNAQFDGDMYSFRTNGGSLGYSSAPVEAVINNDYVLTRANSGKNMVIYEKKSVEHNSETITAYQEVYRYYDSDVAHSGLCVQDNIFATWAPTAGILEFKINNPLKLEAAISYSNGTNALANLAAGTVKAKATVKNMSFGALKPVLVTGLYDTATLEMPDVDFVAKDIAAGSKAEIETSLTVSDTTNKEVMSYIFYDLDTIKAVDTTESKLEVAAQ